MPKTILTENDILEKSPTGIVGLDEITGGGLPKEFRERRTRGVSHLPFPKDAGFK